MLLLAQVDNGNICAGLLIKNKRLISFSPALKDFLLPTDSWPKLRMRLLHQEFSIWQKQIKDASPSSAKRSPEE